MVLVLKLPESQEREGQIFYKKHELPLSCNTPITIYTADENFNLETFRCHYAEHELNGRKTFNMYRQASFRRTSLLGSTLFSLVVILYSQQNKNY